MWQTSKGTTQQEISQAFQSFFSKFGVPPQVLEVSDKLEKVELPEGLTLVTNVVRIPKNIMFIGTEDGTN
jgi:hypothetical protein